MNRFVLIPAAFVSLLVFAACDDQTSKPTTAPSAPPAAATIADEDLAVPADFAEEADQTITVANYKTELDTIETEVNGS